MAPWNCHEGLVVNSSYRIFASIFSMILDKYNSVHIDSRQGLTVRCRFLPLKRRSQCRGRRTIVVAHVYVRRGRVPATRGSCGSVFSSEVTVQGHRRRGGTCVGWSISQRWPESLFQTPLLFQNFWIRVRQFFKFENPTLVQTPATIIDPTVIYPCFYFRNDRTDSCCCRNLKVTPEPGPVKKRSILQESTPVPPLVWRSQQSSKK